MHAKGTKHARESAAVSDCTKISCVRKVGEPRIRKLSGYKIFWIYSTLIFIEGLDNGLRKHVKLSQPENLQAAFQAARATANLTPDMERQSLSQAGASDDPQFSRNDGFGQSTLAASQAFGRASGNWKQHSNSGRKRFQYQKQGRCYICGRYGQFARSCRQHPNADRQ